MTGDDFNQPIHQVLSGYSLLEVAQCDNVHFSLDQPLPWRMNLCAISQLYPTKYFIAVNNKICVYGISSGLVFTKTPIMVLTPSTNPEFMINAIKVGPMAFSSDTTDEILIAVSDNGDVFGWNTRTLFTTTTTTPVFYRSSVDDEDDPSTWGIAIHPSGLVAVSANNHRITIYNLRSESRLGQRPRVVLAGHTHNIPCIDFDSSGRYLASGSIDMTCRLWDLDTLAQVGQRSLTRTQDSDAWLWGIKFLSTGDFKGVTCDNEMVAKRFQRHVHQDRPTNTTDLHLQHSAKGPIYQLDMHQMFHRLRTDESDDDDDPAVLQQLLRLRSFISQRATLDEADADLLDWEDHAVQVPDDSWGSYSGEEDDGEWAQGEAAGDDDAVGVDLDDEWDQDEAPGVDDEWGEAPDVYLDDDGALVINDPSLLDDDQYGSPLDEPFGSTEDDIQQQDLSGGDEWHDDDSDESVDNPLEWNTNQRDDYDDLLAEEEGWMQDRSQFPWHWLGVESGGDQHQPVTSLLQDDDTSEKAAEALKTSLEPSILAPKTSNIPYVFEPTQRPNATTPMDYLMITSKKDAYLLHPVRSSDGWSMPTVQRERGVISQADARTAFALDMMERLSFVEWIPELELCVMASQKGCVVLMRMLQVTWPELDQQSCLFNHETYLPLHGLQNSVLYGMTVHRLTAESSQQPAVYQLLLLYLDGTMRSYRLSKPTTSTSLVDLISVL